MKQTTRVRLYVTVLVAVFIALGSSLWLPGLLLWWTGELWPADWIVHYQRKNDGLLQTGLLDREEDYKKGLYDHLSPDVIAIGSSRILQVRQRMLSPPFVNMGRALEMLRLDEELQDLTRSHKPKIVLWGVDYWHFAEERAKEQLGYQRRQRRTTGVAPSGKTTPDILPRQILSTWSNPRVKQFWHDFAKNPAGRHFAPGPRVGLGANLTNDGGFASDGSHYRFSAFERPETTYRRLLERLDQTQGVSQLNPSIYQLRPNERVSPDIVRITRSAIATLVAHDIRVIICLLPLPARTIEIARRPEYSRYFEDVKATLTAIATETETEFFDYLDGAPAGVTDREFWDLIHPGEVATSRVLQHMAARSSTLRNILNLERLSQIVRDNAGMPAASQDFYGRFGISRVE